MNAVRNSLVPFILVSSVFHLLLVVSWYARYDRRPVTRDIPIRVLPVPPEEKLPPPKLAAQTPTPKSFPDVSVSRERPPGQLAKNSRAGADPTSPKLDRDPLVEQPVAPKPQRAENETIVIRELPTLKDLLPPLYLLSPLDNHRNRNEDGPIRLDSRDPRYVAYLSTIERAILLKWNDPYVAKSHGLYGKLVLAFTIEADGQLENLRLVRSSGYSELDDEAIRIVQAAAPFGIIPRSVGRSRIPIDATFIYEREGVSYRVSPSRQKR